MSASAPPRSRRLVFVVAALALFVFALDQTAVATALTTLSDDLGVGIAWGSWTVTAYALGQILALPLAGGLCARYGARRTVLCSVGAFAVLSLGCGLSQDIVALLTCRFLQGVACGAVLPAGTAIVAATFGSERDRAVALFTNVFPIGAIVGPVLGGLYLSIGSWRLIFLANAPIAVAIVVAAFLTLPDAARRAAAPADLVGVSLLMVALLAGMATLTQLAYIADSGLSQASMAAGAIVAVVVGRRFVRHSRRHPHPVVPPALISGRGLGIVNLTNFVIGSSALGFSTLVPVYGQLRYDLLPVLAGTLLTARAFCIVAMSSTATAVLRRFGFKPILIAGMLTTVVGLCLTAAPPPSTVSPALWLTIASSVMGLGMGLSAPASSNACMHLVPDEVPAVTGLRMLFRQMGAITAISTTTAVTASSTDPGAAMAAAFAVLGTVMLITAAITLRLPNHRGRW